LLDDRRRDRRAEAHADRGGSASVQSAPRFERLDGSHGPGAGSCERGDL
jgi:hypothetical protein